MIDILLGRHTRHDEDIQFLIRQVKTLTQKVDTVMTSLADLATTLTGISAKLDTLKSDLAADITRLQAALANQGGTTPEVDAAVAALTDRVNSLTTTVQAVDALAPAPAPTPTP